MNTDRYQMIAYDIAEGSEVAKDRTQWLRVMIANALRLESQRAEERLAVVVAN